MMQFTCDKLQENQYKCSITKETARKPIKIQEKQAREHQEQDFIKTNTQERRRRRIKTRTLSSNQERRRHLVVQD